MSDRQRAPRPPRRRAPAVTTESAFRGLLDAASDAILGVGSDGVIVVVNGQAERLFGYAPGELIGQPVEILVPHSVSTLHPSHREQYLQDPRPRPMGAGLRLVGCRKDGTEFPVEVMLSAVDTPTGLLVAAAVRDVSERLDAQEERDRLLAERERRRFESQLHQSQRLESLGQLAGGVAHDFNNLLAVILIYTSLISEQVGKASRLTGGEQWAAALNDIEQISLAAERATQLTRQLLAFARRDVVQPRILDLNDVITGIHELLRRTLGEQVELVSTPAADLWPIVADPGQLEQVLINLAVNSRDAMPRGGTLSVDTENVVIDEPYASARPGLVPGRFVRLRVSDTGTGMDEEVLAHAFEPFFTTKPKGEGTGLGLATVFGIVSQTGGAVRIHSEPGLGTTVSSLFPASEQLDAAPEAIPEGLVRQTGRETVLVVEDEDAMREVTRRILARNGYKVITACSGPDALAATRANVAAIDALVTDVVMPRMLGKEVAERLTAIHPHMRVLYMSGYAQPVLASQGTLEAGITLLEKPFTEAQLLARLREVLDAT